MDGVGFRVGEDRCGGWKLSARQLEKCECG
jgi:hypothetical protein